MFEPKVIDALLDVAAESNEDVAEAARQSGIQTFNISKRSN